jgi:hypothetical protein
MNKFADVLDKVWGRAIQDVLKDRIMNPIGATNWTWNGGGAGNSGAFQCDPDGLARFGWLFCNGGNWNGTQLIAKSWVDQVGIDQVNVPTSDGKVQDSYGLNWWCNGNKQNWPDCPVDCFGAFGYCGQYFTWTHPAKQVVVAHRGPYKFAESCNGGENFIFSTVLEAMPSDNTPPSAVSGLTANALSESVISLSWSAASDGQSGITGYNIYRDDVKVGFAPTTAYSDSGLSEGTSYTYHAAAVNGAGLEGPKSNAAGETTMADNSPPGITDVHASGDPERVTVVFNEPIEQASAQNPLNYTLDNNIVVSQAMLGADLKTVILQTSTLSEGITYTLTVNNVKDRAKTPNTIAPDSKRSFTYVDTLIVTLVQYLGSSTSPTVEVNGFVEGAVQANDRSGSQWTNIPSALSGLTYLLTARNDKSSSMGEDEVFYRVNVSAPCTVFTLFQTSLGAPSWISSDSWENTSMSVSGDGSAYSVYKKYFAEGDVDLKRQPGGGSQGTGYVFKLAGSPSVEANGRYSGSRKFALGIFPNPFKQTVTVHFNAGSATRNEMFKIDLFDIKGSKVPAARDRTKNSFTLNTAGLASGIYLVKVNFNNRIYWQKIVRSK